MRVTLIMEEVKEKQKLLAKENLHLKGLSRNHNQSMDF